jgi:hypothetical protein
VRKTERGRWETREMRKISGKKGRMEKINIEVALK